jgi:ribosomal protein S18 acetylase RimI-like enzyme
VSIGHSERVRSRRIADASGRFAVQCAGRQLPKENVLTAAPIRDLAAVRAIEERAFNAWPALQTVLCDGWLFRFAEGYTKRANSANALVPADRPFEVIRATAAALYAAHGLPLIFRLSPLAREECDAALDDAGFRRVDETLVMTALLGAAAPDPAVSIRTAPDPAWSEGFADANGVLAAKRRTHERMLACIRVPAAYAELAERGERVAYGLAVAERGMVGLFDVVTLPAARRRGAARRLVAALLDWGRSQGATAAYLQVVASNVLALALYDRLGFSEAYRYHYRVAP